MAGRPASALTKARIELIQAQRDGQELKNAQLRGALVTSEEVEQRWSDIHSVNARRVARAAKPRGAATAASDAAR